MTLRQRLTGFLTDLVNEEFRMTNEDAREMTVFEAKELLAELNPARLVPARIPKETVHPKAAKRTGNEPKYKVHPSGTAYHVQTPDSLVTILEKLRETKTRIRIHYGDTVTGRDWEERSGIQGTIGRSTGSIKIPLMIYNCRSMGGGAILDHCIVKVTNSKHKSLVYYKHPTYHLEASK